MLYIAIYGTCIEKGSFTTKMKTNSKQKYLSANESVITDNMGKYFQPGGNA